MILRVREKKLTNRQKLAHSFHTNTHRERHANVSEILHPEFRCIYATHMIFATIKNQYEEEISSLGIRVSQFVKNEQNQPQL